MRCATIANRAFDGMHHYASMCGLGRLHAFRRLGLGALVLAIVLATLLIARRGLPLAVGFPTATAAVLGCYLLAILSKAVRGSERLVYYHHLGTTALATNAFLAALRQPVLPTLEAIVLSVGALQAIGRLGCQLAGCCHGKPSRVGIAARGRSAQGKPLRTFPIQLVEALWAGTAVLLAIAQLVAGRPPGEPLALYLLLYAGGRFLFEEGRGDRRPHLLGWSEAQWVSGGILSFVALWRGSEVASNLPIWAWCASALSVSAGVVLHLRHARTRTPHPDPLPRAGEGATARAG